MRLAQRHGLDTETRRHDWGDRDYREVQNTEILQYNKLNLPCLNALQFLLFYNALDHDIKITFSTLLSLQRCHCAKSSDDKPSLLVRYLSRKRCTSMVVVVTLSILYSHFRAPLSQCNINKLTWKLLV